MMDPKEYGYKVVGPIVFEYVSWILEQAKSKNLKTLYFLARDGYILKLVAELINERKNYHIQCRYLYCSRMALRMPTYYFIGNEAYDLLLQGGYHITPYILMARLGLKAKERIEVYHEVGVEDENAKLTHKEYCGLVQKLRMSSKYKEYLFQKSKASYCKTISYFRQEGLFDKEEIAIVDSGWSGSMQRSLRQLMEHEGYRGTIIGHYFGLFNMPREQADGEYLAYYFSAFRNLKNKVYFDNTLFECMLSAPHGMTLGYESEGEFVRPILKENLNENFNGFINALIYGALEYVKSNLYQVDTFNWKKSVRKTYKILKRAVVWPTKDELEAFCSFGFCDDVAETQSDTLVQKHMIYKLRNHMLVPKAVQKILRKDNGPIEDVFWPFGLAAYYHYPLRLWYYWNVVALQWIRCVRLELKEKRKVLNE